MSGFYGLIGETLKHSISPMIHSSFFKELQIDGCYHLFEVQKRNLKNAICGLAALGAEGVNVTIPYKVDVMEYLDTISSEAQKIGSVNTICFKDGKTTGYNSDYYGFGMLLDKYGIDITGKKAAILGTGGASKCVMQYLLDMGIKDIALVSRDVDKLKNPGNMKNINIVTYNEIKLFCGWDMIINCTPCGMYPNTFLTPVDKDVLYGFSTAVDLIYNPAETLFLKYAREAGLKGANGLYMLVGQAAVSQKFWNGVTVPKDSIDSVYDAVSSYMHAKKN